MTWKPEPFQNPLTDAELEEVAPRLLELQKLPGWELYQQLLQAVVHRAREAGFEDPEPGNLAFWKGYTAGLVQAQKLLPEILATATAQVRATAIRRKARSYNPAEAGDPSL